MPKSYRASATIRVARFVKQDTGANNQVTECDANDRIIGVTDIRGRLAPIPSVTADPVEAALVGEDVLVHGIGETVLVEAAGAITRGNLVKADADGKAVVLAETAGLKEESGGTAEESSAADGDFILVRVSPQTVTTET